MNDIIMTNDMIFCIAFICLVFGVFFICLNLWLDIRDRKRGE